MNPPSRVFGIDFSGAAGASRRIWITRAAVEGGALTIGDCFRADRLPSSARDRDRCLAALRSFIESQPFPAAFGLDFPFGSPRVLVREANRDAFALSFAARFGDCDNFRHSCRAAAGGRELQRVTGPESHTPFSPYNLRLFRQTCFGIRSVLAPLVRDGLVSVVPMQRPAADKPWLLEICPASTLKARNLYDLIL